MYDRREFIQIVGSAAAAGLLPACRTDAPDVPATEARTLERIGIALYSIPHLLNADFTGTLEMIAELGYKELEFAGPYFFSPQSVRENSILIQMYDLQNYGYYDHSPAELTSLLDNLGLEAVSAHVGLDTMQANLNGVLEAAHVVGHRYVVCPMLRAATLDEYKEGAALFNQIGERSQQAGVQFIYHNHHHEFGALDGRIPLEILMEETDPALVNFELDLFWTTLGGVDPVNVIEHHPGRVRLLHIKDMAERMHVEPDVGTFSDPEAIQAIFDNIADVGEGIIDFARVFASAAAAGIEHYFIERDFPDDQKGFVERSYEYLSRLQY